MTNLSSPPPPLPVFPLCHPSYCSSLPHFYSTFFCLCPFVFVSIVYSLPSSLHPLFIPRQFIWYLSSSPCRLLSLPHALSTNPLTFIPFVFTLLIRVQCVVWHWIVVFNNTPHHLHWGNTEIQCRLAAYMVTHTQSF